MDTRYDISRLKRDDLISVGRVRQELFPSLNMSTTDSAMYIVSVADIGRLYNISYAVYGRPDLWWAIALANKIKNPFSDLEIGQTLTIPTIDAITEAMEKAKLLIPSSGSNV